MKINYLYKTFKNFNEKEMMQTIYKEEQEKYIANKLTSLISQIKPLTATIITISVGSSYKPNQKRTMTVNVNIGKYLTITIDEDNSKVKKSYLGNISEDEFNHFLFLNNFKISEFQIIADEIFSFVQEINKDYKSEVFCFAHTTEERVKNA